MWRDKPRQFAEEACYKYLEEGKFALGKTKIFFRTGQVALLEQVRLETLNASAVLIQSRWRGYVARKRYEAMMKSIRTIQAATRKFFAVRQLHYLQMHRAAIAIQSAYRGYVCRARYQELRAAVLAIQAHYRAAKVRAWVMKMRYEKSAIIIQKYWRGYLVRREEIKRRQKIVLVQCCVRRWLARRRLRELKIESRSVNHFQKLNSGLENKVIGLQMKLDSVTSDRNRLAAVEDQLQRMLAELVSAEAEKYYSETLSTLQFSSNCRKIENKIHVNEEQCGDLIMAYKAENKRLREEMASIEERVKAEMNEKLAAIQRDLKQWKQLTIDREQALVEAQLQRDLFAAQLPGASDEGENLLPEEPMSEMELEPEHRPASAKYVGRFSRLKASWRGTV
ncbi:unnamed protein product [Cylicocyclus nassatus]|uniref:Myosin motor domain-containing protein n=1 Tax=Cylicocyclus nassatus TaxID=53992 RepID=A0AA36GFM2_CYLNA|nr:unnamed protein product [Cylicocyclus nassatus]